MLDLNQVLIFLVVTILTVLIVLISVQVYNLLKELRRSVEKINKILDDSSTVTGTVARQVNSISDLLDKASGALSVFNFIKRRKNV